MRTEINGHVRYDAVWNAVRGIGAPDLMSGGRVTVLVAGGGRPEVLIKVQADPNADNYLAMWTNGAQVEVGRGAALTSWGAAAYSSIGVDTWFEMVVPAPLATGGTVEVRVWAEGAPRPATPLLAHILIAGDLPGLPASGAVRLAGLVGDVVVRELHINAARYDFGMLPDLGGWTLDGTVTDLSHAALELTNNLLNPALWGAVRVPRPYREGVVRVLAPRFSAGWIMSLATQINQRAYAVWSQDNPIRAGYLDISPGGGGFVTAFEIPRPDAEHWVEVTISVDPASGRTLMLLRVWSGSQARDQAQSRSGAWGVADLNVLEGGIHLGRLSAGNVIPRLRRVEVDAAPIWAQAELIGHWIERSRVDGPCAWTGDQGAELRVRVSGTLSMTLICPLAEADRIHPDVSYSVDGGPRTRTALADVGDGSAHVVIVLPSALEHAVSIIAEGIDENTDTWHNGGGWFVSRIDAPGGRIKPWQTGGRLILNVGDSISAGIVTLGYDSGPLGPSTPRVSAGSVAYGRVAAGLLGARIAQVAHGATGMVRSGSGSYPPAPTYVLVPAQRRTLAGEPTPDVVLVNHGQNDGGLSSADFVAGYRSVLTQVRARYPGVRLALVRPFLGQFAADIQALAAEYGAAYLDTTGVLVDSDYVDHIHPTPAGHNKAGVFVATALRAAFGAGYWS